MHKNHKKTAISARNRRITFESLESRHMMATLTVSTLVDELDADTSTGDFSLREAIAAANATSVADVINFRNDLDGVIALTLGELTVSQPVTINGPVVNRITLDANNDSRIFHIHNGNQTTPKEVAINNLAMRRGSATDGGAILNNSEYLTLKGVQIYNSTATGATGRGGAINTSGSGSTIVLNSTMNNNNAFQGGAVNVERGIFYLINSTLSGNAALDNGGGLATESISRATITNATITGNHSDADDSSSTGKFGGGVARLTVDSIISLNNSIVAGNYRGSGTFPGDLEGTGNALGATANYNIIGDTASAAGITHFSNGNYVGNNGSGTRAIATILNTTLRDNGGPTPTHALVSDSLAINSSSSTFAVDHNGNYLASDQRTLGRESSPDRGSYELASSYYVSSSGDTTDRDFSPGNFTLREALSLTNAYADSDFIYLQNFSPIVLNGQSLEISNPVQIRNYYSGLNVIDGNNRSRIFTLLGTNEFQVDLYDLKLRDGKAARGGAIYNEGKIINLKNTVFENNQANVQITPEPDRGGGAIEVDLGGVVDIENSAFINNTAQHGGAINVYNGHVYLTNSTVSGNNALGHGGGIRVFSGGSVFRSTNSTIVLNNADSNSDTSGNGGGVFVSSNIPYVLLQNTIVAGNTKSSAFANDIGGTVNPNSAYNLIGAANSAGGLTHGNIGNIVGINGAGVNPITSIVETTLDNTHDQPAHIPTATSLARDHGSNALAKTPAGMTLNRDQRGETRITDANADGQIIVDIGAVETQPPDLYGYSSFNYQEGGGGTIIYRNVYDRDTFDFNGGRLVFSITSNASADDRLLILSNGSIVANGSQIFYNGSQIATYSGGVGSTPLQINFTSGATPTAINLLFYRIIFKNVSQNPSTAVRTIKTQIGDGHGGLSLPVLSQVHVSRVNDAPRITGVSGSANYRNGNTPIVLAPNATASDVDNTNFNGGRLRIQAITGSHFSNRINIGAGFVRSGNNLLKNGVVIGTVNNNGGVGTTALDINFNNKATVNIVTQLMRSITFSTSGGTSTTQRSLQFTLLDGSGSSTAALKIINVSN